MSAPTNTPFDLRALNASQAKALATVLDSLEEVIEITDVDGRLVYVNKAFVETTGYSLDEAQGRTPKELLRDDSHDAALYDAIWDTVVTGGIWQGEFSGRRKDGTRYHQLVRIRSVKDQGKNVFLFAIKQPLEDVRKDRREVATRGTMEAELQAVRTSLRSVNEELVAAASMAMVGQLAAAVGHEINNPAQVLRSCLEHLSEQGEHITSAERKEVLEDALMALSRVETVTSELVPFAGSAHETPSSVDMVACVRRGLRMVHNELRHRSRVVDALGELPSVTGIEARLSQLTSGLLVSLARGMEEDSEANLVTLRSDFDENWIYIRIDCQVATPGSFFHDLKASLANRSVVGATNQWISLLLCQQIAVAHGGSLLVQELTDKGARLTLQIRRGTPLPESDQGRVLIIDDEELILRSLRRMLRSRYEVDVCDNGKDAIELICDNDYDVIVCDVMMPGMSGVAVYEALSVRKPEALERMIFISAGTFTDKTQDFVSATRSPVLGKPLGQEEFLATIEKVLLSSRPRR